MRPRFVRLPWRATVVCSLSRLPSPRRSPLFPYTTLFRSLRWREPAASGYHKAPADPGGPPPLVVATAAHAEDGGHRLRVAVRDRSEEHTSELQSRENLVCRLLLEKKKQTTNARRRRCRWH